MIIASYIMQFLAAVLVAAGTVLFVMSIRRGNFVYALINAAMVAVNLMVFFAQIDTRSMF